MTDVFIAVLRVDEMFIDPAYQRVPTDVVRARKYAAHWERRLVGVLEVSDRGEDASPRYAIVDGQHRWAAMHFRVAPEPMAANVHSGLTIADEAALFDKLNRQRKQTNTWDHWKARLASGDDDVVAIEAVTVKHGLRIEPGPRDGQISCTAALEKVAKLGGTGLIDECLSIIIAAWQDRRDGLDAPIVQGLAMVLHHLRDELDHQRLVDTLIDVLPRQIKTQAAALREMTPGTLPVVTAVVIVGLYNKRPGRRIEVSHRTFGGTGVVNSTRKTKDAPPAASTQRRAAARDARQVQLLEKVGDPSKAAPRTVPDAVPHYASDEEHTDAVARMEGRPVAEIAQELGIAERTVRRIQADLGIEVA